MAQKYKIDTHNLDAYIHDDIYDAQKWIIWTNFNLKKAGIKRLINQRNIRFEKSYFSEVKRQKWKRWTNEGSLNQTLTPIR